MTSYISTRGLLTPQSFIDVLLSGMAPDGGLYIPEAWPAPGPDFPVRLDGLSYAGVAFETVKPFIGGALTDDELRGLLNDTYGPRTFDNEAVAPLVEVTPDTWIMELFHGPTLSFKDYALQFLGRLFDHVLEKNGRRLTIVGATSGDTGSAAIEACRGCRNIDIFILHPKGRTSDIQRRQMTTIDAPNVFNIALEGTFDDCQAIVKTLFADEALRRDLNLSAVNSINWARIMMQAAYYVNAAVVLGAPERGLSFAVPTGNFGNVYAAWTARRMGLPVDNLVIGTNRNDILTRFFETGTMEAETVTPSLSPSMDIQISSNFERYLCDLLGRDFAALRGLMKDFAEKRKFSVNPALLKKAQAEFRAFRCDDQQTLETMKNFHRKTGQLIDPHTAVGLHAATEAMRDRHPAGTMVVLACAHPAKFPDAVRAATGVTPPLPARLAAVLDKPERYVVLPNDSGKIRAFVTDNARPG